MLRLAEKAFWPGPDPVPGDARRHRPQLPRGARVPRPAGRRARRAPRRGVGAGVDRRTAASSRRPGPRPAATGCRPSRCSTRSRSTASTPCSAARRRDEEKARAKERVFSLPRRVRPVGPEEPAARAVEPLQRPRTARASTSACSRSRTGPSSTSGSTSRARSIELPSIYYAHQREVFRRDGMLLAVTAVHARRATARSRSRTTVRYRTVGDATLHRRGRVDARRPSTTSSPRSRRRRITERGATRADDQFTEAAMEDRKREGYF